MRFPCLGVLHFTSVSRLTSTVLESTFSFLLASSSQVSPCASPLTFPSHTALSRVQLAKCSGVT